MSTYDVGYGKPPKKSQFKKGTSGNPKGRPKGSKNLNTIAEEQFLKPITVTKNGKKIRMPIIEVAIAQLLKTAAEGDLASCKVALDYFFKFVAPKKSASIADLVAGQSPFELSPEDMARISKDKLLKGVT